MSMPKKFLLVQVPVQTLTILEILCRKTKRTKDDITREALTYIFEEYKEIILDTLENNDSKSQAQQQTCPHKGISLESYKNKKLVTEITELELAQINLARIVITQDGSHYSQILKDGGYLFDDKCKWQVFDVEKSDLGIIRVILWNESDDGSFSVHFADDLKPEFYCFEN